MKPILFYTPRKQIPAFAIIYHDNREPGIDFYNHKTKAHEEMPVSVFIGNLQDFVNQ